MEKEAKIGLTVILVLLITFAAVLARKMYGSHSSVEALAASDENTENPEKAANLNEEAFHKQSKTHTAGVPVSPPTVVTATSVTSKPPLSTASDAEQGSTTADSDKIIISADDVSPPKPAPSFMPTPPKPNNDQHYARYDASRDGSHASRGDSNSSGNASSASTAKDSADYRDRYIYNHNDSQAPAGSGLHYAVASYRSNSGDSFARQQTDDSRHDSSTTAGSKEIERLSGRDNQKYAGRTYAVVEGDSLYDIARFELGKATRWVEIYDLNRDILGNDLDHLTPGTQILIPDINSQNGEPVTDRLTGRYYR